jgi:hypothetical protein
MDDTNTVPKRFYHYTSSAGLLGILRSGIFRATNYSYLNDKSEVKYSIEVTKNTIKELYNSNENKLKQLFLNRLEENFISRVLISDLYVCSFCKNGDKLSLWRAYGPATGRVSIEFDLTQESRFIFQIGKIIYDQIEQKKIVSNKINEFDKYLVDLNGCKGDELDNKINDLSEILSIQLMNTICYFKDESFKEEEEIRVSKWIDDSYKEIYQIDFSESQNIIKPYIELIKGKQKGDETPILPITKICIGPSDNQDQIIKSIIFMLYKFGYKLNVRISKSEIQLR